MNLEINPLKVYEQYYQEEERRLGEACTLSRSVTSDEAANCDAVKNIIAPRLVILREIADGFVDTIIENKEQVPYGIRWICKQIRSLTKVFYSSLENNGMLIRENSQLLQILAFVL